MNPHHTETPHPAHQALDRYDTLSLVAAFIDDQRQAADAVHAARAALAQAVEAALPRIARGGRLVYVGAGTSGRLGVLDSVELFPTFSWPRERSVALLAGGPGAMFVSVEGAEDSPQAGADDLVAISPAPDDVVLLVSASGTAPYVLGALEAARAAGTLTIGFANNPGSLLALRAQIGIVLATGAEVISGSTRLKAGTAQKIALNAFSSSLMVRLHKVYGNLMVDLQASNSKLVQRALALTMRATGCNEAAARTALDACGARVKVAIVMLQGGGSAADAEQRLAAADGDVRRALEL